jgi:hypothetical protein
MLSSTISTKLVQAKGKYFVIDFFKVFTSHERRGRYIS